MDRADDCCVSLWKTKEFQAGTSVLHSSQTLNFIHLLPCKTNEKQRMTQSASWAEDRLRATVAGWLALFLVRKSA